MRLIFAESRGDSFHLKSTEFTEVDSRPFGEKKGKKKEYIRTCDITYILQFLR